MTENDPTPIPNLIAFPDPGAARLVVQGEGGREAFSLTGDGVITFGDGITPSDAAAALVRGLEQMLAPGVYVTLGDEIADHLASDLMEMDRVGAIELDNWATARTWLDNLHRRHRVLPEMTAVEAGARAAAIHEEYDGCFERLDAWAASTPEEREMGRVEEPMSTDLESATWWRERMAAALAVALPSVTCPVCDELILPGDHDVLPHGNRWAHRDCAEGGE